MLAVLLKRYRHNERGELFYMGQNPLKQGDSYIPVTYYVKHVGYSIQGVVHVHAFNIASALSAVY